MATAHNPVSARRRILCLGGCEGALQRLLPPDQWELVSADSLKALRLAASDRDIRVMVAAIGFDNAKTLELAEELLFERRDIRAVGIIEPGTLEQTRLRRALSRLFFDFLTMPLLPEAVQYAIGHAYGMASISCCGGQSEKCISPVASSYKLFGRSDIMVALRERISRISTSDAPVMIGGESGTGKELAARNVHAESDRCDEPFVAVNMAAIPENLVQTELFGHEKGAFTGAAQQRIGHIESAHGGTLFLDEIGDLPLQSQGNLLRFLQEGVITRVGGSQLIKVDVRVITATHIDLEEAVAAGRFREDLYYRLNVLQLEMPPLRDRGSDIAYLAERFFEQFCARSRCCAKGLSQRSLAVMKEHDWPGNVREMLNRIQRAVVMCTGQLIHPEDLGLERRESSRKLETLAEARARVEKQLLRTALIDSNYNLSEASRLLGTSRVTLYKLIDKHGIQSSPGREVTSDVA